MKRATIVGLAAAAGSLLLVTLVARMGAQQVSSLLLRRVTILSPVPTKNTITTGEWNGLPENYAFNPYIDEEHVDDWVSPNPWASEGQYGMFMNINDATINSFGCGPAGPIACNVGTTPSQHYARGGLRFANGQKMMVGSFPTNAMPGLDPEAGRGADGKQPAGYGNQGAQQPGSFYNSQRSKQQSLLVGSFPIVHKPGEKEVPHQPHGWGNQAAQQAGSGFFNQKSRGTQSLMVGSYPIVHHFGEKELPHQPIGYGNEASQGADTRYLTSQKMSKAQSLLVGSFPIVHRPGEKEVPHQPHGWGNQAAQQAGSGFYNQ